MKVFRLLINTIAIISLLLINSTDVFAASINNVEKDIPHVEYSIEFEDSLENAEVISSQSNIIDERLVLETVYQQSDGTIITDTLIYSAIAPLSENGSDTVTRIRTISGWGTISITASFDWYTKNLFSYVRCSSMSATYSINSGVVVSTWETDHSSEYLSIGKAEASVNYYMYNSAVPFQFQEGTFKITCSDSGTISDNG